MARHIPLLGLAFAMMLDLLTVQDSGCLRETPPSQAHDEDKDAGAKIVPDAQTWPAVNPARRTIGNHGSVTALSFSRDGTTLASWHAKTKALYFHDVSTGKEKTSIPYPAVFVHAISYAPNGQLLATGDTSFSVQIWDLKSGKLLKTVGQDQGSITSIQFPSGEGGNVAWIAAGVVCWDLAADKELFRGGGYRMHKEGEDQVYGPTEWYSALAFSPDGKWVVSSRSGPLAKKDWGSRWSICAWQLPKGEEVFTLPGHKGKVTDLSFSPDGKRLATVGEDRTLRFWDLEKRAELFRVPLSDAGIPKHVVFLPGGKRVAVGMSSQSDPMGSWSRSGDLAIRIYDAESGVGIARLPAHEGGVERLMVSPDGKTLASCGMRGPIFLWDMTSLTK